MTLSAYSIAGWESFLVAEVGAAAALTGLVFVAISINLTRILAFPGLPGRAGSTISMLLGVLIVATLLLVPGQPARIVGVELTAVGLVDWAIPTWGQVTNVWAFPNSELNKSGRFFANFTIAQIATIPFIIGGLSLIAGTGGGLYWMVPGILFSFLAGTINAWVLLVEILR